MRTVFVTIDNGDLGINNQEDFDRIKAQFTEVIKKTDPDATVVLMPKGATISGMSGPYSYRTKIETGSSSIEREARFQTLAELKEYIDHWEADGDV